MKMKVKLLASILLVVLCGCVPSKQPPSTEDLSSQKGVDSCSAQPTKSLSSQSVTSIILANKDEVLSGMVNQDKQVGYTFAAKSGQTLQYQTDDNICVWIYTPDNQVLGNGRIPHDGKYVVQVSAAKGSTTFNLKMRLVSGKDSELGSTASSPTQVTRVEQSDPEKFIQEYYTAINNRDYKFAWTDLSLKYKQKSGDFSNYVQWWDSVESVIINSTNLVSQEKDSAVVEAELLYRMKEGGIIQDDKPRFYLIWNSEENHWDIDDKSASQ
jgi:hypothetical protein